jgi:REP element-mobilizing transposase RayT
MIKFDPEIHDRQTIRMKSYDYSKPGNYFITICTQNKISLFGEIANKEIILNAPGLMIKKWWLELNIKFENIKLHDFIIMPNHFHGIIEIVKRTPPENLNEAKNIDSFSQTPLPEMIQWFKTMTTNEYIHGVIQKAWKPFESKVWQRNYYEHIIRDRQDFLNTVDYICENPLKWDEDQYHQD